MMKYRLKKQRSVPVYYYKNQNNHFCLLVKNILERDQPINSTVKDAKKKVGKQPEILRQALWNIT